MPKDTRNPKAKYFINAPDFVLGISDIVKQGFSPLFPRSTEVS